MKFVKKGSILAEILVFLMIILFLITIFRGLKVDVEIDWGDVIEESLFYN